MFILPSELTIVHVEKCKEDVLKYIDGNENLSFDDSKVTRIDTLGTQLLLAIVTYIAAQKKTLTWSSSSQIVKESIKQLGIGETLLTQYLPA